MLLEHATTQAAVYKAKNASMSKNMDKHKCLPGTEELKAKWKTNVSLRLFPSDPYS